MEKFAEGSPEFGAALGEELGMLAEHEAPPSAVSAAEAVRRGRSRIRRRRTAVVGAVAAVLVLAGSLGSLRPDDGPHTLSPAGPWVPSALSTPSPLASRSPSLPPTPPSPQSSATSAASTGSDPLNPELRYGWLPDGIATITQRLELWGTSTMASASSRNAGEGVFFILAAYPRGVVPGDTEAAGIHVTPVPAPAVNGRPAYWLLDDKINRPGSKELRWQLPDGRWAELDAANLAPADVEQVVLRVAADVTPATQPVPLPFTLALPSGYKVTQVEFDRPVGDSRSGWTVHLVVLSQDGRSGIGTEIGPDSASTPPNEVCRSDRGVRACVSRYDSGPNPLAGLGGPSGWLGRFTLLGTDESNWTTGVTG